MWGLVIYFIATTDAVFSLYQDAFTSTFRDVVLGTKTIGKAQLLRRSPTFIEVYF